jgi:hypothetical protein
MGGKQDRGESLQTERLVWAWGGVAVLCGLGHWAWAASGDR